MKKNRLSVLLLVLYLCLVLSGCEFFLQLSGPVAYVYDRYILVLAWDYEKTNIENAVYFEVYYRDLGTTEWNLLQVTENSDCKVQIKYDNLGNGDYEFAVRAVYDNGEKSNIHSSSDFSAWPPGGWYINWRI